MTTLDLQPLDSISLTHCSSLLENHKHAGGRHNDRKTLDMSIDLLIRSCGRGSVSYCAEESLRRDQRATMARDIWFSQFAAA